MLRWIKNENNLQYILPPIFMISFGIALCGFAASKLNPQVLTSFKKSTGTVIVSQSATKQSSVSNTRNSIPSSNRVNRFPQNSKSTAVANSSPVTSQTVAQSYSFPNGSTLQQTPESLGTTQSSSPHISTVILTQGSNQSLILLKADYPPAKGYQLSWSSGQPYCYTSENEICSGTADIYTTVTSQSLVITQIFPELATLANKNGFVTYQLTAYELPNADKPLGTGKFDLNFCGNTLLLNVCPNVNLPI